MLNTGFYLRSADIVAKELLGKLLVHFTEKGNMSGIIVETEAYTGAEDAASHAYRNLRTGRTEVMYANGGCAYIYLIYGMYNCLNVVANIENKPEAVLIRALQPLDGVELMKANRGSKPNIKVTDLCNGPGKLCKALGIDRKLNGISLTGDELFIVDHMSVKEKDIKISPRVNIDYAGEAKDYMLRYYLSDNKHVSRT